MKVIMNNTLCSACIHTRVPGPLHGRVILINSVPLFLLNSSILTQLCYSYLILSLCYSYLILSLFPPIVEKF
jgi:hypothetical protein